VSNHGNRKEERKALISFYIQTLTQEWPLKRKRKTKAASCLWFINCVVDMDKSTFAA
jgi:hypothetical protein